MENVIKIVENENKITQKFADHKLHLDNRKKLNMTGIDKVISANSGQIIVKVGNSKMYVAGKDLTVVKLDVDAGIFDLIGEVFSIKYNHNSTPQGFFRRFFK